MEFAAEELYRDPGLLQEATSRCGSLSLVCLSRHLCSQCCSSGHDEKTGAATASSANLSCCHVRIGLHSNTTKRPLAEAWQARGAPWPATVPCCSPGACGRHRPGTSIQRVYEPKPPNLEDVLCAEVAVRSERRSATCTGAVHPTFRDCFSVTRRSCQQISA